MHTQHLRGVAAISRNQTKLHITLN